MTTTEEIKEPYADLHTHTTASDGTSTVEERISQARERGVDVISITDHDRIPVDLDSSVTQQKGVEVITGVEVRADLFDTKIEILGYFVNPNNRKLRSLLEHARGYREKRNREMVDNVSEETGLEISYETLDKRTGGSLGRPYIADILVEEEIVDSVPEAFEVYLGEGGDCYVPMERLPYKDVIEAVHKAGGVASLAHPGRIRSGRVREMVKVLSGNGLDALEVWYPYGEIRSEDYADISVEDAYRLAEDNGLVMTGGSDCHGPGSGKYRLGEFGVTRELMEELRSTARSD